MTPQAGRIAKVKSRSRQLNALVKSMRIVLISPKLSNDSCKWFKRFIKQWYVYCILIEKHKKMMLVYFSTNKFNCPAGVYMLKANIRNNRRRCEICSKLKILWTYFTPCFNVSIVNFEHVIAGWELTSNFFADFLQTFFVIFSHNLKVEFTLFFLYLFRSWGFLD